MLLLLSHKESLIAHTSRKRPAIHYHLHSTAQPTIHPWDLRLYLLPLQATPFTTKRHNQEQNQLQVCTPRVTAYPMVGAKVKNTVVVVSKVMHVFTREMTGVWLVKVMLMNCRPPFWCFLHCCHLFLLQWHPCHLYIPASISIPGHRTAAKVMGRPTVKQNHLRT